MKTTKNAFNRLNLWRQLQKEKSTHEMILEQELRKTYPNLQIITLSDSSIRIETRRHVITMADYNDGWKEKPQFICSQENKMPKNVNEFLQMKKEIKDDYKQCLTVAFYVGFRYKWWK